ncbi:MAG: cytochrome-c peroxidase [Betaproteobacteria bacterium]
MRTTLKLLPLCGALAITAATAIAATSTKPAESFARPASPPIPADNSMSPERVELGKMLFFDPRLSGSGWISCATCHNPALGWSDGLPTAIGHGMKTLKRHTPTILNAAYYKRQMWDGRFASLEEQALGPIGSPDEMNMDMAEMVKRLKSVKGYMPLFERAYPGEGISPQTVAKAIASFERTIVSGEAPFDRWVSGDRKALSESARRGFELFRGKADCVACHEGPNFTDDGFHNIGVKPRDGVADPGRFAKVPVKAMKGALKTPSLRDVAYTAPYMHNGAYSTLREVVEMYSRGGDTGDNLDPNIRKLDLTSAEVDDIVEFLKSLSGYPVQVVVPQLPY